MPEESTDSCREVGRYRNNWTLGPDDVIGLHLPLPIPWSSTHDGSPKQKTLRGLTVLRVRRVPGGIVLQIA